MSFCVNIISQSLSILDFGIDMYCVSPTLEIQYASSEVKLETISLSKFFLSILRNLKLSCNVCLVIVIKCELKLTIF